ncbi:MAG: TM2 domain-containing protein [Saprospiraceae bacterium]
MKHFFTTLVLVTFAALTATQLYATAPLIPVTPAEAATPALTDLVTGEQAYGTASVDEFLALTPRAIREKTGEKLSLKEVVVLKMAQKKVKKMTKKGSNSSNPKSQLVALLLVVLVGGLGVHRFYLGYTTIGIIQLFTLGGCGIWSLIDLIRIVTGDLLPEDGSSYDPEL